MPEEKSQKSEPNASPKDSGEPRASKDARSSIAKREEEILKYWQENNIFEKSVENPASLGETDQNGKIKGEFVFYDGPPFATGLPHYGSLLSSVIKDVIPRYKTMRGFSVRRRWGWDCHGLPIENMIEKKLELKDKTEIENKIGIKEFNETCRSSVLEYANEWKRFVDRIGRWVEYKNAYMTMDSTYTESVWWGLKQIFEKGLLYEGRKVLLYCPHCQTPLAKAEVQMDNSYKDITEEAVTVEFRVKDKNDTSLLAWTTTPWTLPGNVALAVGGEVDYVEIEKKDMGTGPLVRFILAKDRLEEIFGEDEYVVVREMKGSDLVGFEYEPLYEIESVEETGKKAWYVADADFVTTEEGTGIVHTAVMYGEDDYKLGVRLDLPMIPLLDEKGHFTDKAPEFIRGQYFKKAEKAIKEDLKDRGLLFKAENHTHSYPHCHRCGTALLYNAITSWFFDVQKIKSRLIELNEKINWIPNHLKHGRFLNIVEAAPDWTISRNRYWASPLPIWKSASGSVEVVGSLEELKQKTNGGNKYFVMRHGGAHHTVAGIMSTDKKKSYSLTEEGREEVRKAANNLKNKKISKIYYSPLARTKETAEIVAESLGLSGEFVVEDERLRELDFGDFDGATFKEFLDYLANAGDGWYSTQFPNGSSYLDAKKRFGEFLYEVENHTRGEEVLIVTHGVGLESLPAVVGGWDNERSAQFIAEADFKTAEVMELDFAQIPHNDNYELDYHRPYIDKITWTNDKGEEMRRIPEVVDGWVEAASMPFAEYHYPFENKEVFEGRFPGDFVAEYIAQTRTWFYYMLVVSTLLFDDIAFKNVLTTGNILAEDGSKMSKSKGNYTDPMINMDRYGADAVRYSLMTSVVMQAEDVRFLDEDVKEVHNRLLNLLKNTHKFYEMYVSEEERKEIVPSPDSSNVLDRWVISRLNELNKEVTDNLEAYNTVRAGRPIRDFVSDLSQWYLRRSRDRFKSDDEKDRKDAITTTHFVLLELSKLIAPFVPFMAEDLYLSLQGPAESVHLAKWPEGGDVDEELLKDMEEVREVVSLALEQRSSAGIKVRQPLAQLKVKSLKLKGKEEYLELIKDEVNVKEVVFSAEGGSASGGDGLVDNDSVELDVELTPELEREGHLRDLLRAIQDMRKKAGLTPDQKISLLVQTNEAGQALIEEFAEEIRKSTLLESILFEEVSGGEEIRISESSYKLKII